MWRPDDGPVPAPAGSPGVLQHVLRSGAADEREQLAQLREPEGRRRSTPHDAEREVSEKASPRLVVNAGAGFLIRLTARPTGGSAVIGGADYFLRWVAHCQGIQAVIRSSR